MLGAEYSLFEVLDPLGSASFTPYAATEGLTPKCGCDHHEAQLCSFAALGCFGSPDT